MPKSGLYFIALVPPLELREKVKALKEEMKRRFNAKHALKSPAHITLQMPFKRDPGEEKKMEEALEQFSARQSSFTVNLSGFDSFAPRVIFLKVEEHGLILELHSRLKALLTQQLDFPPEEVNSRFHPHMTIATRDLHRKAYREAWSELGKRPFNASFFVKSLFLLKHNGKYWDIFREFMFGKT